MCEQCRRKYERFAIVAPAQQHCSPLAGNMQQQSNAGVRPDLIFGRTFRFESRATFASDFPPSPGDPHLPLCGCYCHDECCGDHGDHYSCYVRSGHTTQNYKSPAFCQNTATMITTGNARTATAWRCCAYDTTICTSTATSLSVLHLCASAGQSQQQALIKTAPEQWTT